MKEKPMYLADFETLVRYKVYKNQLQGQDMILKAGWTLTVNEFKHEVYRDPVTGRLEDEQVAVAIQELRQIQKDLDQKYSTEDRGDHDQLLLFDYPDV